MALAPAFIFILLLCCQPASASSARRNTANGQQKWSREDYNSLSRNRRDTWWWLTTKPSIRQESLNSFSKICQTCTERGACLRRMAEFCRDVPCPLFRLNNGTCTLYMCDYDRNCSAKWNYLECHLNRCYCKKPSDLHVYDQKCKIELLRDYYRYRCDTKDDCRHWKSIECVSGKCVCPKNYQPNHDTKICEYKPDNSHGLLLVVVRFILVCAVVYACVELRSSSSTNDFPPVAMSALTNTSSTRDLLDGQADIPPDYTDVYMKAP